MCNSTNWGVRPQQAPFMQPQPRPQPQPQPTIEKTKYCSECGEKLESTYQFCSYCGSKQS